ncbi:DNA mismatch repair protein MutS [Macrococcus sp. DPC7161]|uniref:DNA mismatch repair protein MutS n=1 Tax=Macrococcus sp. DPC7161 TaxID=2507060 RepID=UPI00100A7127|nr:DNA mismatch repair protein MutS [Macrococcus sp. DPC7161]RXK19036.1 DNA mismatch repair protein MutS [Macrococcus sp. DPC7161]
MTKQTPMMQQYLQMKEEYKDCILFFRLGDFYEMFHDDAILAARELEITLTRRDKKNNIPMCGVPHHSAKGYIERLIEKGYKVAIAEQMEDPKMTKGMVKREVVQIITPGTVMDDMICETDANYIVSIYHDLNDYSIAYSDVSTGELKVTTCNLEYVLNELSNIKPREIILNQPVSDLIHQSMKYITEVISIHESSDVYHQASQLSGQQYHAVNLLLSYVQQVQKRDLSHIDEAIQYETKQYMQLDMYAKRNLELTESIRLKNKKGTLLSIFKECKTPMGHRKLKEWIERPLINETQINARLQIVNTLNEAFMMRHALREALESVYDIERLVGRVQFGNVNGKDLIQLKYSLQQLPILKSLLEPYENIIPNLQNIEKLQPLTDLLESSLNETQSMSIREGNLFKDGFNATLDEYRDASRNGKHWLAALQTKERERTGVKSLKISYNKVFGYYIEVSKVNLASIDVTKFGYERKQTLSNAERFITDELKEKESIILGAEEKALELEYQLFLKLRDEVSKYIPNLKHQAKQIAELDCLQNFSEVATNHQYVMPKISKSRTLHLKDARHPVVETVMDKDQYVENDCLLDDMNFIYLITGPNMSGKSTYMRQVALISIMMQMGSFVPCSEAELPIFDQIFTRIGAADDLVSGQSTFMVEMLEAKNALTNATENSLIIFDEIGRGTSTYDGLSLAQAMIEYVHNEINAKTLFSTHYHELVDLENQLMGLSNVHVAAKEHDGQLIFLHKVLPGAVEHSYGIHVANLAALPSGIIDRAKVLLKQFENHHQETMNQIDSETNHVNKNINYTDNNKQQQVIQPAFDLFNEPSIIEQTLKEIDVDGLTAREALNVLYNLKAKLK